MPSPSYERMLKGLATRDMTPDRALKLGKQIEAGELDLSDAQERKQLLDYVKTKEFEVAQTFLETIDKFYKEKERKLQEERSQAVRRTPPPLPPAAQKRMPPPLPPSVHTAESNKENQPPTPKGRAVPPPIPPKRHEPAPIAFHAKQKIDTGGNVNMKARQEALAKAREATLAKQAVEKVLDADQQSKKPLFTLLRPGVFDTEYKRRRGTFKNVTNKPDPAREGQIREIESALANFNMNPSLENIFKLSHTVEGIEKSIKDKSSDLRKMCSEMKTVLDQVRSEIGKELSKEQHKVIRPR